jgi:hypothetical protein
VPGAAVPDSPSATPGRVPGLHREREPGRPQLRVVVSPDEEICDALVEECDDRVYVRVVMCYDERKACTDDSFVNCPVHVYLKQPLGELSDRNRARARSREASASDRSGTAQLTRSGGAAAPDCSR